MNYFSKCKKQWDAMSVQKHPLDKSGYFFSILPILSSCREIAVTEGRIHRTTDHLKTDHENRPLHFPPPTLSPDWRVSHKGRAVGALCTLRSPECSPGPDPEQELNEGKGST